MVWVLVENRGFVQSTSSKPLLHEIRRVRKASKLLLHRLTQHTLHRRQHRRHAREFAVEIARVGRALDLRQELRGHLFVRDVLPVDIAEEGVAHDLLCVRGAGAKAFGRVARQELLKDGNTIARHVDWVQGLVGENGVVDFVFVFAAEGGLLEEHLVDQHAESPPVHRAAIFLVKKDLGVALVFKDLKWRGRRRGKRAYFWRHKLGSATKGAGGGPIVHIFLAETVVGNFDVPVHGEEDVVKLEIAIHYTILVEVFEC